jgi:copper chaperone CopZ
VEEISYRVPGMSCGHCERAVSDELERVPGVSTVEVDLETKRVTVQGTALVDEALRAAIDAAGYEAD